MEFFLIYKIFSAILSFFSFLYVVTGMPSASVFSFYRHLSLPSIELQIVCILHIRMEYKLKDRILIKMNAQISTAKSNNKRHWLDQICRDSHLMHQIW